MTYAASRPFPSFSVTWNFSENCHNNNDRVVLKKNLKKEKEEKSGTTWFASIKFNLPRNYASGLIGSEPDLSSRYDKHVHNFVAKENET